MGITPGLRVEVGIILLMVFIYVVTKRKSVTKSLFYSLITYIIIFLYGIMPYIVKSFLNLFNLEYSYSSLLMQNFYLLLLLFLGTCLLYLYNKKYFTEIIKDIRMHKNPTGKDFLKKYLIFIFLRIKNIIIMDIMLVIQTPLVKHKIVLRPITANPV